MQIVNLSLPFGQVIPNMCCPVCGANIQEQEENPTCPHLLFTYFDACGFGYVNPEIESLKDEIERKADDDEDGNVYPPEALAEAIESDSAVCLAVTGSGMACGPVSYTSYVAIDIQKG